MNESALRLCYEACDAGLALYACIFTLGISLLRVSNSNRKKSLGIAIIAEKGAITFKSTFVAITAIPAALKDTHVNS